MSMIIQMMPTAKQIQPMGFSGRLGRLERPPREGEEGQHEDEHGAVAARAPRAWRLHRSGRHVQHDARSAQEERESSERPCQPGGGSGAHPTGFSTLLLCLACHNTTLQYYRLLKRYDNRYEAATYGSISPSPRSIAPILVAP